MRITQFLGLVLVALLISASYIFNLYGDWLWFSSVGYSQVFMTVVFGSAMLALLTGLGFFAFSFLNLYVARKCSLKKGKKPNDGFLFWVAAFLAFVVGSVFSDWRVWLKFLNPSAFAGTDPVFGLNMGFYVFTMPFYGFLLSYAIATVVLTMVLSIASYATNIGIKKDDVPDEVPDEGEFAFPALSMDLTAMKKMLTPHISVLLGFLMVTVSFGMVLAQWGLLYSENGAVFGAAYTDLSVTLYVFMLLSVVSLVLGILFFLNARINRWRLLLEGVAALAVIAIIGFMAVGITQAFIVSPDEFNVESPYIERNIENTFSAYGLQGMSEQTFPVEYNLSSSDVQASSGTIGNIRLWDWRPLTKTYNQLQLFRTYYDFNDVDIDRYHMDGTYRQVMVSAREMNTDDLPENAKTWVNEHLVYTHGYGVVMNPVDKVSAEGLPEFIIQNIPPETSFPSLEIERPEIYYGEDTLSYVVVETTTKELDYPSGEQNIYTVHENSASGVPLGDMLSRLTYAVKFGSIELLVSNSLTEDSRVLLYRDIRTRLSKVAPFLRFDSDPYIVVSQGKLYWIADAYTVTDMYPYSEPVYAGDMDTFNYIRNSVKAVVDAYTGDVTFYVVDSEDPLIKTYMKIFPGMFTGFSEMPEDLQGHVRYPEDLFSIQSHIYSVYHMRDTRVFYNKEDVWVIPDEIYMSSRQRIRPYFVIVHIPGEDVEEFVLMIPFTPRGKENLIGWMAARCDQPAYGDKLVYQFSKQELVYGPMQIEARIDQDTDISQLFTLWGQAGSGVIRGNTLVIPLKKSILYIEPIYLEATERGTLPELKRVIVAYGNRLTMQKTLQEALTVLFGQVPSGPVLPGPTPGETPDELLNQIAGLYEKAQQALSDNNLGLYQQYINQIGILVSSYE